MTAAVADAPAPGVGETVLTVNGLTIAFDGKPVVRDVDMVLRRGETLALVGESGSGKSISSLALLGLTPPAPGCRVTGSIRLRRFDGSVQEIVGLSNDAVRTIRGNEIGMVFQEPMTSLNPVHTIGTQIAEAIIVHRKVSRRAAHRRAVELIDQVGIPDAARRAASYPHHLSGGMRQRAMIALALACSPRVLIADEPTTALDVTVQAQIIELLRDLQRDTGMAILFITHNLGVVAHLADRVAVMYAGTIVEEADVVSLFARPRMPYTRALMRSVPLLEYAGRPDRVLEAIEGNVPDPRVPVPGCQFHPRCASVLPGICDASVPAPVLDAHGNMAKCFRAAEFAERAE